MLHIFKLQQQIFRKRHVYMSSHRGRILGGGIHINNLFHTRELPGKPRSYEHALSLKDAGTLNRIPNRGTGVCLNFGLGNSEINSSASDWTLDNPQGNIISFCFPGYWFSGKSDFTGYFYE